MNRVPPGVAGAVCYRPVSEAHAVGRPNLEASHRTSDGVRHFFTQTRQLRGLLMSMKTNSLLTKEIYTEQEFSSTFQVFPAVLQPARLLARDVSGRLRRLLSGPRAHRFSPESAACLAAHLFGPDSVVENSLSITGHAEASGSEILPGQWDQWKCCPHYIRLGETVGIHVGRNILDPRYCRENGIQLFRRVELSALYSTRRNSWNTCW